MEVRIVFMCLVIPCLDAKENQSDKGVKSEFSLKADICKSTGQSLEVNCSFTDKGQHSILSQSLNCSNTDDSGVASIRNCSQSSNLRILHCTSSGRKSCIPEKTTKINDKTIGLYKSHLTVSDSGTYFCQYSNLQLTEDNFYLTVGDHPVGPVDISCVSLDLTDLQCSWTKSRLDEINPVPVRYKSYFTSSPQFGKFDCRNPVPLYKNRLRDDRSCYVTDKFHPNNLYKLYINMTNCLGSRIVEHNVSLTEIVKLSPPILTSIKVEERQIQINLVLNYTTERTLIWIKSICYHISYVSEYSTQVKGFTSAEKNSIKVILRRLIPNTKYDVTIKIRGPDTEGDTYWSLPVTYSYTTKPAAPDAIPTVPPGGFSIHDGYINVYLKPIARKDKHAANTHYKVSVEKALSMIRVFNISWDHTTIENVTTLRHGFDYKIAVTTCNDFGETNNATIVKIPAISRPKHSNVIVERLGSNYTVFWNNQIHPELREAIVIVYWCHGQRSNNFCKNDLNWVNVSKMLNNITMPYLPDKLGGEWLFAVSYQYRDGYNTGMIFAKCYFTSNNEAPSTVEPFNVVVTSSTELQITPLLYCKYTNRPLQFIAYYKETEHVVELCDETFQKKEVSADIETRNIIVTGLKQSAKYAVCLTVVTKGGSKTSDVQIVQMDDAESYHMYIILGIIFGVLIIAVVLFLICKCRRNMQKPIHIELPKITKSQYERVSNIQQEHTNTRQNRYSSDSGVASNTVSADVTSSNSTINDNETTENIYHHIMDNSSQNEHSTDNDERVTQKAANGYIPNEPGNIQIFNEGLEREYKRLPSLFNENKFVMKTSDENTSYRQVTLSTSGLGDIYNYSDKDCEISTMKGGNHKTLENVQSSKPILDGYISNITPETDKQRKASYISSKCMKGNSGSYRKVTFSTSGLGDIEDYSDSEEFTISYMEGDNHKSIKDMQSNKLKIDLYSAQVSDQRTTKMDILNSKTVPIHTTSRDNHKTIKDVQSSKPKIDCYILHQTQVDDQRTTKMDISNSKSVPMHTTSKDFEIAILLEESNSDENDQCDEIIAETEEIDLNKSSYKSNYVCNDNLPGYIIAGYDGTVK